MKNYLGVWGIGANGKGALTIDGGSKNGDDGPQIVDEDETELVGPTAPPVVSPSFKTGPLKWPIFGGV